MQPADDEAEECSFCLSPLAGREVSALCAPSGRQRACRHFFHADCAAQLGQSLRRCPVCSAPFEGSTPVPQAGAADGVFTAWFDFIACNATGDVREEVAADALCAAFPQGKQAVYDRMRQARRRGKGGTPFSKDSLRLFVADASGERARHPDAEWSTSPRNLPAAAAFPAASSPPLHFAEHARVRFGPWVARPAHGWGRCRRGEAGRVLAHCGATGNCLVCFPSERAWRCHRSDLELLPPSPVVRGASVVVKAAATEPFYKWGPVSPGMQGIVTAAAPDSEAVVVSFPNLLPWKALCSELDVV
ncbi:hypothetical protein DIPPA_30492 [Diplonema papillatum]|nr:hypothetical protein DIPPA_30492 [Diplonema papillatum]|eukprot:gene16227-24871_t